VSYHQSAALCACRTEYRYDQHTRAAVGHCAQHRARLRHVCVVVATHVCGRLYVWWHCQPDCRDRLWVIAVG
ncbi:eamA-like transporter family protein, partial [Vibrio parahaemolyticus V-223/04]